MLEFVGLGLYDERSISRRGAAAIAAADHVYLEAYTSVLPGVSVDRLEDEHGSSIDLLGRDEVEADPEGVLEEAAAGHVVFLTGGDPMIATTHVDLRLRAHERGIDTRLVHGTSAATAAAGLSGLQHYRFGRAVTLPLPAHTTGGDVPPSVLGGIDANRERGLHTLAFLDLDLDGVDRETLHAELDERCLDGARAAGLLAQTRPDTLGVVIGRAGSDAPTVAADRLEALAEGTFGPPLHLLVVPGELHEMEARALVAFAGAPEGSVEAATR